MAYGWGDFLKERNRVREDRQRRVELSRERIKRITSNKASRLIRYPTYMNAFDYVHGLYPYAHVRSATVYQVPRSVSEEAGYRGAGGFFDIQSKIVVITDCVEVDDPIPFTFQAQIEPDEVLCHELIHFAANYKNPVSSRQVEEEIAYGKSVGYLKLKGHSDDHIIDNIMMPYLVSYVNTWDVIYRMLRERGISMTAFANLSPEQVEKQLGSYQTFFRSRCVEEARRLGMAIITSNMPREDVKSPGNLFSQKSLLLDDDL
jgi:hypothetical protein